MPCIYFEGNNCDNDALQDLLDLLQITCVDPERREERWAVVAISKSGDSLEPAVALRVFRREAAEFYGLRSEWPKALFVPVTGTTSQLRNLFAACGQDEHSVLTIPDNVGSRYSVFTAGGLVAGRPDGAGRARPAARSGGDDQALPGGAVRAQPGPAIRRRQSPDGGGVRQAAARAVGLVEEAGGSRPVVRASAVGEPGQAWAWADAADPVQTRDLHSRGQQHQDGPRDRLINNLVVKTPRGVPILVQMSDHNEDDLNAFTRKGLPDLMNAALVGANQAYFDVARPTADLVLPALSEHTMGQLLQMLMLATVVEGRLLGVNPYGAPGADVYQRYMLEALNG